MNDMNPTIVPKSDQMNADDLIGGPRTITIRDVKIAPGTEQPVAVYFAGDDGKPFLPCKSMRRVMVALWGADANAYVGRSMTLYRDPTVTWGGMEVGGIRISHMTDIEAETRVVLTATKKTRKPFIVLPLVFAPPAKAETATDRRTIRERLRDRLAACFSEADAVAVADDPQVKGWLGNPKLTPEQLTQLNDMLAERYAELRGVGDDGSSAAEPVAAD